MIGPVEEHRPVRSAFVRRRNVMGIAAANSIAVYDFLTYSFFAVQIGRAFFPSTDPTTSLLASLGTFGAGFAARPLGAIAIGRLADSRGRASAMQLSFLLMGVALIAIAVLPTYAMIGPIAPVVVVLLRLLQGFAFGGELGASTAYLVEAAPPDARGRYVSVQYLSQDLAILAAGLIGFTLARELPSATVDAWGWRVAFMFGAGILPVGYFLRRSLPETLTRPPHHLRSVASDPSTRPVAAFATAALAGSAVVTYVEIHLVTHATVWMRLPQSVSFTSTIALGGCGIVFSPIGGWLSDRFGRKPVMLVPWAVLLILGLPLFRAVVRAGSAAGLVGWTVFVATCAAISITALLTSIAEAFPASRRSTAIGLIYAVSVALFGGSTQFIVAWLTKISGDPAAPAWYMTAAVATALAAMLFMPETGPHRCSRRATV